MRTDNISADDQPPAPLAAALAYADFGYGVFPCTARDRAPLKIAGLFEHGFKSATLDPAVITTTWMKYKGAEIGLAPPLGILVVDPDMKKGRSGRADFIRLFGCPPEDTPTAVSTTPLGGWHVYLCCDPALELTQRPITPSVDIKVGGKGYVLAPYSGNGRHWIRPLLTTPLMDAPAWLIDELRRPPERETDSGEQAKPFEGKASARASQALDRACAALIDALPGTRDATIGAAVYRVGRLAGAGELEPEDALARLISANAANPHCRDRRDRDKIKRQFDKGFASPAEPGPIDDRHAVEDDFGDEGGDEHHGAEQTSQRSSSSSSQSSSQSPSGSSQSSSQQSAPWESIDPAFLGADVPPPELTDDMSPSSEWGELIGDLAESATAPPDYVALSCIVGAAGVIGNSVVIEASPGWKQPSVLWGAAVGAPGAKKTPGMNEAHLALIAISMTLRDQWEDECKKLDAQHQAALDAHKAAKEAKKAGKTPRKLERPPCTHLVIDDITVEKVTLAMANSPRGLVGYYPELASWFGAFERYSTGGGDSVRAFWNKTFDALPHLRDRVGAGEETPPVFVPAAACSVMGGVQPDKLRQYLREADDGLMARLIYVWPYKRKTQGVNFRRDRHSGPIRVLKQAFQRLYALPLAVNEKGAPRPTILRFAKDAEDLFSEANQDCEDRVDSERGIVAQYLAKGGGRIMRLALVFEHMAWALRDEDLPPGEISRDALARAIAYFHYSEKMLRRMLVGLEPTQATDDARDIAILLVERRWTHFAERDVSFSRGFRWFRGVEHKSRRLNALGVLQDCHVIRQDLVPTRRGAVQRWAVHPDLAETLHA
jgi:hypothetical protein